MLLNVGDKIPEILGIDQSGKEVKASDYAGKKLVLYFYPKDNTPACTAEACNFRDNFYELRHAGYEILGVSIDGGDSHNKFIDKHELPFPLIADTDKKLIEQFGLWVEKTMAGKKYMGTQRATFLVDGNSTITHIMAHKEIKTKEHAEQILEIIK